MIVTNIDHVPGKEIAEIIGIVRGNVVGRGKMSEPFLESIKSVVTKALSWGPRIVTGEEVGLVPPEEMKEAKEEGKSRAHDKELEEYSDLLSRLRQEAMKKMVAEARKKGADGVLNVKFGVNVIMMHAFEVCAYGTAVKLS
jgi:uncharacterized protein YbjQ (UPF0145 family)